MSELPWCEGSCKSFFLRARANDAVAITTREGVFTVGEIMRASDVLAARILASLRAEDDRPCILVPSSKPVFFVMGLIACSLAGATAVPWRDDTQPLARISDAVRPDAILEPGNTIGDASLTELEGPRLKNPRVGELIMMTSGSTGVPKGVALDLAQVALNASSAGSAIGVWRCSSWAIDIDMALMSAVCHFVMAWQFDLPFVHLKEIAPAETLSALPAGFGFGGSPLQLTRLHERLAADLPPKIVVSSGDFFPPAMIDIVLARFPQTEIHKLYGLTELGGRFCHMPHSALMRNKSATGHPLPGLSARIANRDRHGYGEVEARTVMMARGYYLPGGEFQSISNEWFATGDIGRIDDAGVVTLVGRADDIFKVGGEKVDRASIEAALAGIMQDRAYCVLPVEHDLFGLCPALFVAVTAARPAPKWADIVAYLRSVLPTRYIPSLMYAVEENLPRLPSGKLDRLALTRDTRRFTRLT